MGADQVVRVQNLYALVEAEAEAEVQLVNQCLSAGRGGQFGDRCGRGRMFETGKKVQVVGHGFGGAWAVALPGTGTLRDREVD